MQTIQYMPLNQKSNNWFHRLWFGCSRRKDFNSKLCYTHHDWIKNGNSYWLFWKAYPRSCLLKTFFVSCDAGVIDSDFRGTVLILMPNNSKDPILIKPGQRIAQIVFPKKEELVFKKLDCSCSKERGGGCFGSTGI